MLRARLVPLLVLLAIVPAAGASNLVGVVYADACCAYHWHMTLHAGATALGIVPKSESCFGVPDDYAMHCITIDCLDVVTDLLGATAVSTSGVAWDGLRYHQFYYSGGGASWAVLYSTPGDDACGTGGTVLATYDGATVIGEGV